MYGIFATVTVLQCIRVVYCGALMYRLYLKTETLINLSSPEFSSVASKIVWAIFWILYPLGNWQH